MPAKQGPRHSTNTYATETPITDGEHVYAYFGMTGVYCYDLDGQPVWERDLGSYEMRAGWGTSSSPALYDDKLIIQVDNEEQSFLVALDNNRVIGSGAVGRIDEQTCELKRMWLLEPYQGQGIGYRLLQALIDFARQQGYTKMWLETDQEQEQAIRFYRRVGFQPIPRYNNRNSDVYLGMDI